MKEYLPGEAIDRIVELRTSHGYSQKDVADKIGIDRSTYSKIESGKTKTIGSHILKELADIYDVTSDFIMGINDTPDKTYYEIGQLGLSVEAAGNLYSKKIDPRVVNELLINDSFCKLTRLIASYLSGETEMATRTFNNIQEFKYQMIMELTENGELPDDDTIKEIRDGLKASKEPIGVYELKKIESMFTKSIREIKKKVSNEIDAEMQRLTKETLDTVKAKVFKNAKGRNLSNEEKKRVMENVLSKVLSNALPLDPNITSGQADDLKDGITKIASVTVDYGKGNATDE